MREAVIGATARTPTGKAYRVDLNDTQAQELAGPAVRHAVERAGVAPEEVDDVVMGCALQQGSTGSNVARQGAVRAGQPNSRAEVTAQVPPLACPGTPPYGGLWATLWASKTFFWLKTACRPRLARVPGQLRFITDYAARSGIVVVIAEQMAALALKVSRQGLVLRRGSVVLAGTGEELLHGQDGKALAASYL